MRKLFYLLYEAFDNELACPSGQRSANERFRFPAIQTEIEDGQSEIAQSVTNQVPKSLDHSLVPVYWGPTGRKSIGSNATGLKILLDGNRRHVSSAISFLFCHISDGVSDACLKAEVHWAGHPLVETFEERTHQQLCCNVVNSLLNFPLIPDTCIPN
ncbi:MAG: hypothetical protein ACLQNE_15085 [Thermoguttaceae bacterium]